MPLPSFAAPLAAFALFAALFGYASWTAARPADPLRPRLAPWRTISVLAGFGAFVALVLVMAALGLGGRD